MTFVDGTQQPVRRIMPVTEQQVLNAEQRRYEAEYEIMEQKRKELYDVVKADVQNSQTLSILYMRRRVKAIIFRFKKPLSNGSTAISFNTDQEDLQEYRLIEIKIQHPYMKILFIPKDVKKPEISHNYNIEDSVESFEMEYIDHCTDCMSPRDKTTSI